MAMRNSLPSSETVLLIGEHSGMGGSLPPRLWRSIAIGRYPRTPLHRHTSAVWPGIMAYPLPRRIEYQASRRDIWAALPYSPSMEISFDPIKDAANVQERGIPLTFGAIILAHAVGELEDTRKDYGEVRQRAFAEVEGKWFQCVYTLRGDVRHIITVHRIDEKRVKRWLNR
jgi:uncharacterized protein